MTIVEYYLMCLNIIVSVIAIMLFRGSLKIHREMIATKAFIGMMFDFLEFRTDLSPDSLRAELKVFLDKKIR